MFSLEGVGGGGGWRVVVVSLYSIWAEEYRSFLFNTTQIWPWCTEFSSSVVNRYPALHVITCCLKGKYHPNLLSFQNPKCLSISRNNKIIVKFVINYHPSGIKLSISASSQRQRRPVWIET